jgi:DNA-binding beta-propeller fold protein YncE
LTNPALGRKEVMADYIEDLQIVNVESSAELAVYDGRSGIAVFNLETKGRSGISIGSGGIKDMTFGSNGLLYLVGSGARITVVDTTANSIISSFNWSRSGNCSAIAFGSDNLLYLLCSSEVKVIDTTTNSVISSFNIGGSCTAIAFGSDNLLYSLCSKEVKVIDTIAESVISSFSIRYNNSNISYYDKRYYNNVMDFGPNGLLYLLEVKPGAKPVIVVVDVNTGALKDVIRTGGVYRYKPDIALDSNGLLYLVNNNPYRNSFITVINTNTKRIAARIRAANWYNPVIAIKTNTTGQESLVTINLTLRTKNQYGKDRQFKKKDYHGGNFKIDKTDKYKRDTFSSTVLVRNLVL